ncbi:portal protein [Dysosmobacter sp.]|uniref:portal protein n=1 Tax=Dysosmobacter sp. TaxID=2591382 RepID=UPI002A95BEC3|nr:hypothetical protein [Dysosmobacter sp.]MDY5509521.1 hypothetical protein [Dysosmobacter sp.]
MKENNRPLAWKLYEDGRDYNNRLVPNQYDLVETNTEFFIGNQWLHLPETPAMRSLPRPTFNILKRVSSLFIASLTSSGVALRFDPLAYYDGSNIVDPDHDAAAIANAEVSNLLEKFKMEYRVRDALFDGAQTGDYCAHFWFDPDALPYGGAFGSYRGEIQMELVDGINVMFGNPNDRRTETQPYILIVGRDTVEHLRWEAERFKANQKIYKSGKANPSDREMLEVSIQPDAENQWFTGVGGRTEIISDDGNGKALYVLLYTKVTKEVDQIDANGDPVYEDVLDKDGNPIYEKDDDGNEALDAYGEPVPKRRRAKTLETSVHVTKATRTAEIYSDVDTGLSRYPIAWGNWEKQKNQYHGRALVTGLINNQIFINSIFATGMRQLQLMAFSKTVYNADLIPRWDNTVGQAIGVHGLQPGQAISQVAYNLQPAEMSNQVFSLIDKVMAYTKECLGATDAQMGNVQPDNTSALMVLQTNAEVPLENIRSGLYEWIEDIGAILLDLMGTYYGKRPVVMDKEFKELVMSPDGSTPAIDPMTGQMQMQTITRKTVVEFDFNQLKHLWLNLRVDVGATTYFSEIAMTQTLDNLRRDGTLDVIQYLERIPDKLIPKKQELLDELKGRIAAGKQPNAAPGAAIPQPGSPLQGSGQSGPVQGGALDTNKAVASLPGLSEVQFSDLPNIAKKTAVSQGAMRAD